MQGRHWSSSLWKNYDIFQREEQKEGLVSTGRRKHPEQERMVCQKEQRCLFIYTFALYIGESLEIYYDSYMGDIFYFV